MLLDAVWDPFPHAGKQHAPTPGLHNSGWVQSPGVVILRNPDRHDELAGMLAWHYESAGEPEQALPLLIAAGGYALRRYANNEAYAFFEKAAGLLPDSQEPEVLRHRVEIGIGMARLVKTNERRRVINHVGYFNAFNSGSHRGAKRILE